MAKTVKKEAKAEGREKKTTSLILYSDTQKKIRLISVLDEKEITEIMEEALDEYIAKWERKNGPLP
jgi:uncharacterized protein YjaZ